jgi:hypothetical protein
MKSIFTNHGRRILVALTLFFSASVCAQVEPTWVREGVDWSQYGKFLVKPLDLSDTRVVKPPYAQDDPSEWTIRVEDVAAVQAIYSDVMKVVLEGNGGYPVVDAAGKDVLEVDVEILTIMPWLKPGGDAALEGYEVKTLGSGELTARVTVRDSLTRELLLLIEGDTAVGEQYKEFTRENNASNIEAMFRRFAGNLRASMDRARQP